MATNFNRRLIIVVVVITFFLGLSLFQNRVSAVSTYSANPTKEDPGGGGTVGDNAILNPRFELDSAWTYTPRANGGFTRYDGSPIAGIVDLGIDVYEGDWSGLGVLMGAGETTAIQNVSESITQGTRVGGAWFLKSAAGIRRAEIRLHITPLNVWFIYVLSDNDIPSDTTTKYYFAAGSTLDEWTVFYMDVYPSLSSNGLSTSGQTIDTIQLAVIADSAGLYDMTAGAFDSLYLGSTPPDIAVTDPSADMTWVQGTYTFSGTSAEHRGLGEQVVYTKVDPSAWQYILIPLWWHRIQPADTWSVDVNTDALTEGTHEFHAIVFDGSGDSVEVTRTFGVDRSSPTGTISRPHNNEIVVGTATFGGMTDDAYSGVEKVEIAIDSGSYTEVDALISQPGPDPYWTWTHSVDTTQYSDGTHTLKVRITDGVGETKYLTQSFRIDNEAPEVTLTSHADDSVVQDLVTLKGKFSDSVSGVKTLTLSIDGFDPIAISTSDVNGDWSYTWNTSAWADGYHHLHLYVEDNVGHSSTLDTLVIVSNDPESGTPFVPVVDENGHYLGSTRTTIGDSQLVIVFNAGDLSDVTQVRMMIAPPFCDLWTLNDISYVDGSSTISFKDSVTWDPQSHMLFFAGDGAGNLALDLSGRSIIVSIDKMDLTWTLDPNTSHDVFQSISHSIAFELSDELGNLPYGLPFNAELQAIQDGEVYVIGTALVGTNGDVTFTFTLDEDSPLHAGFFEIRVVVTDDVSVLFDTTSGSSEFFSGFTYTERPSWSFDPEEDIIIHYAPVIYDQRMLTIKVTIYDGHGDAYAMIGQAVDVSFVTGQVSDTFTIYQTFHEDGVYALFSYNLTRSGDYTLSFTYLPNGFYQTLPTRYVDAELRDVRPVDLSLSVDEDIPLGTPIALEAVLTDAWAQGYPIAGTEVQFEYVLDGVAHQLGTFTTDGYGVAKYTWSPTTEEWRMIAGRDVEFRAASVQMPGYSIDVDTVVSHVETIDTYMRMPIAIPSLLSAGDSVQVSIELYDQFGTLVEGQVTVTVFGPNGMQTSYLVTVGVDAVFNITLPDWGNYSIEAVYDGNTAYTASSASQDIQVVGVPTISSVVFEYDDGRAVAEEAISIRVMLTDIDGILLRGTDVEVAVTWQGVTTYQTLTIDTDSSILFTPQVNGWLEVTVTFHGDDTCEPSQVTSRLYVDHRPTAVDLSELPSVVYPNVGDSGITYDLTAFVTDSETQTPLSGVTVLFCYVTQNESVYLPIANGSGYINLTLASEYLAWGLFHSIGSGMTDTDGYASITWAVEPMGEQFITVFALTLQDDVQATGISQTYSVEFRKVRTVAYVDATWTGDERNVDVKLALWDEFDTYVNSEILNFEIVSLLNPDVPVFEGVVLTGHNDTFTWVAPDYGSYMISAHYEGSEYYKESNIATDIFVVSWRLVDIDLFAPSTVFPGETIELSAHIVDLNATPLDTLMEPLTVYFAYIDDTSVHVIGQDTTDSGNNASCTWLVDTGVGDYHLFAYTKRSMIYDAALSEYHPFVVQPVDTFITVHVNRTVTWFLNYTYTIDVNLTDQFGNDLVGETVFLRLTDNYSLYWSHIRFDESAYWECGGGKCHGNPFYHLFEFKVIIGYNDTFTWVLPGRVSDRILFPLRAIAIAEYSGSSTYLPSMNVTKMDNYLIDTHTSLTFEADKLNIVAGVPQTIYVNVTDDEGIPITWSTVLISIEGPDGQIQLFEVDLSTNHSIVWTPTNVGSYRITAEFVGGHHLAYCHGGGGWRHRQRARLFYNMRLTRSFASTGMIVKYRPTEIGLVQLPLTVNGGDEVELRVTATDGLTGDLLPNFTVSFYYMDSQGQFHHIGDSMTDVNGVATYQWTLPSTIDVQGYEAAFIYVIGQSSSNYGIKQMSTLPVKVWPPIEPSSSMSEYGTARVTPEGQPMSSVSPTFQMLFVFTIIAIPLHIVSKRNKRALMTLGLALAIFTTVSMLYVGLAIESYNHPLKADLIYGLRTNPDGTYVPGAPEYDMADIQSRPTLTTGSRLAVNGAGTHSMIDAEGGDIDPGQSFATSSPNASYVIVPLTKSLNVNFTAYGHYVVSVLDGSQNPVDTVAGEANGNVTVSFRITYPKYEPGKRYTVNTFVTVLRGGIAYGDTSWVVMLVSKTATAIETILETETLSYTASSQTTTIAARLTRMYDKTTIADREVTFYYRSARNLTWHEIGTVMTNELGIASYDWEVQLPKDSYLVNATFYGDSTLDQAMSVKMLTIDGARTFLGPAPAHPTKYSAAYSHPVGLYAQLLSYQGLPLENKTIDFYVARDGNRHWIGDAVTDSQGIASFTYTPYLPQGVHDLLVMFEGDENYARCNTTFTDGLTILKQTSVFALAPAELSVVSSETVEFTARFVNDEGYPIVSRYSQFEIYNPSTICWEIIGTELTDASGYAHIDYVADLPPGKYAYRITLLGDDTTERTSMQGLLTVAPEETHLSIVPVSVAYGQETVIWAHLQDASKRPIVNQAILYYVEIGSTWVPIGWNTTSATGWASLTWRADLPEDTYRVKVVYPGDNKRASSQYVTDGITISKSVSEISLSIPSEVQVTLPAQFNFTLTDEVGNPLKAKEVLLSISAEGIGIVQQVRLQTDQDGAGYYTYVPPYLGDFEIIVSFAGDEFYSASSASKSLTATKIELAISLVVSQTSGHRGDDLVFSGTAMRYDPASDSMIPADPNIPFSLTFLDDVDYLIGTEGVDWYIKTKSDGITLEGHWTIPRNVPLEERIQAGNYTLLVKTKPNLIYQGNTTFDFRLIERTSLHIVPMRGGVAVSEFYVDQATDFQYTLLDEDSMPLGSAAVTYAIDDLVVSASTDSSGRITHFDYVPDTAGGLFTTAIYQGSRFFDPAKADLMSQVFKRDVVVDESHLSATYVHRDDTIDLVLRLTDDLTDSSIIEPVQLKVLLDGTPLQSFDHFDGDTLLSITLPSNLQAGDHTIEVDILESRVYNSVNDYLDLVGFEQTIINLVHPTTVKSLQDNNIRVALTDEDNTPLINRFVELTIEETAGRFTSIYLTTDKFGQADYNWHPSNEGEYTLQASFIGETLFLETPEDAIPVVTIQVQDGGGKTETGPSPLWVLPLLLLLMVDIALEITTFGFVAFLVGEARLGDGVIKIRRIAYPWIEIIWVTVNVLFGTVDIPVPVPVIRSEFEISYKSPDISFEYSSSYGQEERALWGGVPLFDVVTPFLEVMSGQSTPSTQTTSLKPSDSSPETTFVGSGLSNESLDIQIDSPSEGDHINDAREVTVEWQVFNPNPTTDVNSSIRVDGGDYEVVDPVKPSGTPVDGGVVYTYRKTLQTVNSDDKDSLSNPDALKNGAHKIEVKADNGTASVSDRSYFFTFTLGSLVATFLVFLIGITLAAAVEDAAGGAIDIQMAAMPTWMSGIIGGIVGGLICGLNVILVILLLDAVISLFGSETLIWDGLKLPLGVLIGILIIFVGTVILVKQGIEKAPASRVGLFKKLMQYATLITLGFFVLHEILFSVLSLSTWLEALFEFMLAGASAALMGWLIAHTLKNTGNYKKVPTKMQKAMYWGSAGVGLIFGGISMILTTLQEYSRVKYYEWYS